MKVDKPKKNMDLITQGICEGEKILSQAQNQKHRNRLYDKLPENIKICFGIKGLIDATKAIRLARIRKFFLLNTRLKVLVGEAGIWDTIILEDKVIQSNNLTFDDLNLLEKNATKQPEAIASFSEKALTRLEGIKRKSMTDLQREFIFEYLPERAKMLRTLFFQTESTFWFNEYKELLSKFTFPNSFELSLELERFTKFLYPCQKI